MKPTKESYFIDNSWNISKLSSILPKYVVENIVSITIPTNDIRDKII